MSEYFADKDQSFEMSNDDPSESPTDSLNQEQPTIPDESGFSATDGKENEQQQDLIYMGTMAIIILVMLYILYAMFFSGSSTGNNKIEPVKVETPVKNPIESKPMILPAATENQQYSAAVSEVTDREASLSESVDESKQKMNELLQESQYLTQAVRKMQEDKTRVNQRFEDLEREVDALVAANKVAEERIQQLERDSVKQVPKKKVVAKVVTYKLQAVVEGRAWIESSTGKNTTVKVGDIIKDYGVVTKIDVTNSEVSTSSGKTIKVN